MAEMEPTPGILRTEKGTRILKSITIPLNTPKPNGTNVMPAANNNGTDSFRTRIMQAISTIDCSLYSGGFCTKESQYRICPHPTFNKRLACPDCPNKYVSQSQ